MGVIAHWTREAQVGEEPSAEQMRHSGQTHKDELPVGLVRPPLACATCAGWPPNLLSSGHYRQGCASLTWHSRGSAPSASPLVSCDFAPPTYWRSPPTHCQWDSLGPESWHTSSSPTAAADSVGSCPPFGLPPPTGCATRFTLTRRGSGLILSAVPCAVLEPCPRSCPTT